MKDAWLTPNGFTEEPEYSVEFTIPAPLLRYVRGAITLLAEVENWELHGDVSPEEIADYFRDWELTWIVEDVE